MKNITSIGLLIAAAGLLLPMHARAQQATDMPAAVQPGKGLWAVRQIARYTRYDASNTATGFGDVEQVDYETVLAYGFARDWVAMLHVPLTYRTSEAGDASGLRDPTLMFQHRFWRRDTGPINTARLVALGGAELPSGDDRFSSESVDPFVGLAYTQVDGRHGFNASALFQHNAKASARPIRFGDIGADSLRADASYLYRLSPAAYTADTAWSSYIQAQVLTRYETNGDFEALLAPGFLYEARDWAAEITVQLPVIQELDHRAEPRIAVTAGLRFLF